MQAFPSGNSKVQVSVNGGQLARWRRDGRELFFMNSLAGGKLVAVDVKATGSAFEAGTPRELFASEYVNPSHRSRSSTGEGRYHPYAVSPDGQRFVIPRPVSTGAAETTSPIIVVLNWAEGIRK